MNQEFLCWENHVVVKVIFDSFDIQNAFLVANNKTAFINAHNPGGILRPVNVIHSRIVAGKLADAAVKQMLQSAISSNLQTPWPVVTEYDENRADNFQFPDPFDLQITNVSTGHRETVEVRSSFAYRLAPESKIISKLSTYGWYTSASKNIEEPRDWYWQVVYYLVPEDIHTVSSLQIPVFEQCLAQGSVTAFIVGGASKELLFQHGEDRQDQDGANYRAIYPINSGFDYWQMLYSMFNIQRPSPVCLQCGASMVLRTARSGVNAGAQFFGCSKFPNCRGIRQLK